MAWSKWHTTTGAFDKVPFPAAAWLIRGLIPGSGWTLLASDAGVGKSMFAYQVVEALATGAKLLDFHPPERAYRCAYIQVDEPSPEWQQQLRGMQAQDVPLLMAEDPEPEFLMDAAQRGKIAAALKDWGAEFVVFDSAYALVDLAKLDLNTAAGVRFLRYWLRQIYPGPYLLLHHQHKPRGDVPEVGVNAAAGHHTLGANASMVLQLPNKTTLARVKNRLSPDKTWRLGRDPETGRWVQAAKPQPGSAFAALSAYKLPAQ